MKRNYQKVAVFVFSAVLVGSVSSAWAGKVKIEKTRQSRYGAWRENIGVVATQVILNNGFTAWNSDEDGEYRNVVNFDVRPDKLGFSSAEVGTAVLKWKVTSWERGRSALTVDQIESRLDRDALSDMYDNTLAAGIFKNGGLRGRGSIDITAAFKAAMDGATSDEGIAFRWYNDNDADPVAPYSGNPSDWVLKNSGFSLKEMWIEIEKGIATPEPVG